MPALIFGPVAIWRRQRDALHRVAGKLWVLAMIVLAGSSSLIHESRQFGPFSVIHILSVLTFIGLWQGIAAIRRKDVVRHQGVMRGLYLQTIVLAGVFTFLPGRGMNAMFFDDQHLGGLVLVTLVGCLATWLI